MMAPSLDEGLLAGVVLLAVGGAESDRAVTVAAFVGLSGENDGVAGKGADGEPVGQAFHIHTVTLVIELHPELATLDREDRIFRIGFFNLDE